MSFLGIRRAWRLALGTLFFPIHPASQSAMTTISSAGGALLEDPKSEGLHKTCSLMRAIVFNDSDASVDVDVVLSWWWSP